MSAHSPVESVCVVDQPLLAEGAPGRDERAAAVENRSGQHRIDPLSLVEVDLQGLFRLERTDIAEQDPRLLDGFFGLARIRDRQQTGLVEPGSADQQPRVSSPDRVPGSGFRALAS